MLGEFDSEEGTVVDGGVNQDPYHRAWRLIRFCFRMDSFHIIFGSGICFHLILKCSHSNLDCQAAFGLPTLLVILLKVSLTPEHNESHACDSLVGVVEKYSEKWQQPDGGGRERKCVEAD